MLSKILCGLGFIINMIIFIIYIFADVPLKNMLAVGVFATINLIAYFNMEGNGLL